MVIANLFEKTRTPDKSTKQDLKKKRKENKKKTRKKSVPPTDSTYN